MVLASDVRASDALVVGTTLLAVICLYGFVIVPIVLPRVTGPERSFQARAWGQLGYGIAIPAGYSIGWVVEILVGRAQDVPTSHEAGTLFLGLGALCLVVGIMVTSRVRVGGTPLLLALFRAPAAGVTWKEAVGGRKGRALFILEAALIFLTLGVVNAVLSQL